VSDVTARLDAIQGRAANCLTYNFGMRAADTLAHSDVPFLLDLARKAEAAKNLHRSGALPYTLGRDQTCTGCGHAWPCPTTRVLEGA
jgi:hypothetical protein